MAEMVADAYATMADFRTYLRITATTDATDPDSTMELLALEAAARAIELECDRRFTTVIANAAARVFGPPEISPQGYMFGTGRTHAYLDIDDLATDTITTVKFDYVGDGTYATTATASTYRLAPYNNAAKGLPYTRLIFDYAVNPPIGEESVEVTARWGWTAIPNAIRTANLLQAARFLKRRDAPFGIAGSADMGSELRLLAKLDVDVAMMVGPYRKIWGAV